MSASLAPPEASVLGLQVAVLSPSPHRLFLRAPAPQSPHLKKIPVILNQGPAPQEPHLILITSFKILSPKSSHIPRYKCLKFNIWILGDPVPAHEGAIFRKS